MQPSSPGKPSWTAKLAGNSELLCSKIREEAGELCQTLEQNEGRQRAASEMADLLYHSMVLLSVQVSWPRHPVQHGVTWHTLVKWCSPTKWTGCCRAIQHGSRTQQRDSAGEHFADRQLRAVHAALP